MTAWIDNLGVTERAKILELAREIAMRRIEPLTLYDPMPEQALFHSSLAKQRLIYGSARAGKTTPCAIEIGRAVLGCDPFNKYPKRNGRCWIVGRDEDHLGDVIWRKLTIEGLQIVRDEVTGRWRVYQPQTDKHTQGEIMWSPPILPSRYFAYDPAYISKKRSVPKKLKILKTGWEVSFFTEGSRPRRGADVDIIWFDEENHSVDWYDEAQMRRMDRGGCFIWSAAAQSGCDMMFELQDRAELQKSQGIANPTVSSFFMHIDANKYITAENKALIRASLSDEDAIAVRYEGNMERDRLKVYPEFKEETHVCEPFPIPPDWTRYCAIDPGYQVCAVLFAAVAPKREDESHRVYLYRELYLRDCNAATFGKEMRRATEGEELEDMILDFQGGGMTQMGAGVTTASQYSAALKECNVFSQRNFFDFSRGTPDKKAGEYAVHSLLRPMKDGKPALQVFRSCLNFIREIKKFPLRRDTNGRATDESSTKGRWHLMDTTRYLAGYPHLTHVKRDKKIEYDPPAWQAYRQMEEMYNRGRSTYQQTIILGPGGGLSFQESGRENA